MGSDVCVSSQDASIISPTRRFAWEGDVTYERDRKQKEGYVFLFNDLLVLTKKIPKGYSVVVELQLDRVDWRYSINTMGSGG